MLQTVADRKLKKMNPFKIKKSPIHITADANLTPIIVRLLYRENTADESSFD